MALVRPIKDKLRTIKHSAPSLILHKKWLLPFMISAANVAKSAGNFIFCAVSAKGLCARLNYIHTKNLWLSTCMWPTTHPHPNPWHKFIDQLDSKKKQRKQTGCTSYRPDLSFCRTLLDVQFITSKLGLLNVSNFSLINIISLNANLKLLNKNLILLNTDFILLNM